ncbi:MAG: hypothetical protein RIR91_222 [Verrucomicrobiota bacterium]|jgi:HK97 gp10 family phage protein
MDVEIKLTGVAECMARLEELGALGQQKLVVRILRKAAKPTALAAAANARRFNGSGALSKAVKTANIKRLKGQEVARVAVAPTAKDRTAVYVHNVAYKRKRKGIFYGHLVEWGHRIGTRATGWLAKKGRSGKGGTSAGQVPGRPWFTPAARQTERQVVDTFLAEMRKAEKKLEARKGQKAANTEGLVQ